MPNKNGRKPLVREGEPKQETDTGLEIPVPEKSEVMDLFGRAAKKKAGPTQKKRRSKGRRT
jgi:hypothetical protein